MRFIKVVIIACSIFISNQILAQGSLIVNVQNELNLLSVSEVKYIFLGKKTKWSGGGHISACFQKRSDMTGNEFFENVIKKDFVNYRRYWNKRLFAGNGVQPRSYETSEEVIQYVRSNKGTICYVDEITELPDKVKVLAMQ